MKKYIKIILICMCFVTVVACGKKSNLPEVISPQVEENKLEDYEQSILYGALGENYEFQGYDKLTEDEITKVLEYAKGMGIIIEIKNNKMNIIHKQPETPIGAITPWEETELSKLIPRFDKGEMYGTINASGESEIIYKDLTESEANDYVSRLSTEGWKQIDYSDSYRNYIYVGTKDNYILKVDYVEKLLRINIKNSQR